MARQLAKQSSLSTQALMLLPVLGLALGLAPAWAAAPVTDAGQPRSANEAHLAESDDVVATVGDQVIRLSQLTQELAQGTAAGIAAPGYGTPERKRILQRMLDEAIRTDLLYLDALRNGVDQDPGYQRQLKRFKEGAVASLYRDRLAHEGQQAEPDALRKQLRNGIPVMIEEHALDPARDAARSDDEALVTAGDATITWGDAKARLLVVTRRAARSEGTMDLAAERRNVLEQLTDVAVMAIRGREAGLDQDPDYLQRLANFSRAGLAGFHSRQIALAMSPSAEEIEAYAHAQGETLERSDEEAWRTAQAALIQQSLREYINQLETDEVPVTVDEAKLDRLLAQEAESPPAAGGAPAQ